jgi:hypothetical protein
MLSPKLMAELGHAGIQAWQLMHSSVIKIAIGSPFCLLGGQSLRDLPLCQA